MPRLKRSSTTLEQAQRRIAAIKSIDPALNLGNGLTIDRFSTAITDSQQKLETYNTFLSTVDQSYLTIQTAERSLQELSERMLLGVAAKYSKYSPEYVMAGGKPRKTSQRPSQPDPQPVAPIAAAATSLNGNGKTLVS